MIAFPSQLISHALQLRQRRGRKILILFVLTSSSKQPLGHTSIHNWHNLQSFSFKCITTDKSSVYSNNGTIINPSTIMNENTAKIIKSFSKKSIPYNGVNPSKSVLIAVL